MLRDSDLLLQKMSNISWNYEPITSNPNLGRPINYNFSPWDWRIPTESQFSKSKDIINKFLIKKLESFKYYSEFIKLKLPYEINIKIINHCLF